MSTPYLPVLYSFRRCPYAMRARLAIVASGLRCELREVVLRHKPQALLTASPKGTVPVLVPPSGKVLEESLDIMLWVLDDNDPHHWLVPPQETREKMLTVIAENDTHFKPHLDRYKYPQRFDLPDGLAAREAGSQWLQTLESRLASNPYLFGDRETLADMAVLPFVRQFAHTDKAWFVAQPWPQLLRWLNEWMDSALFGQIMKKYTPWVDGTQGVLFPDQEEPA